MRLIFRQSASDFVAAQNLASRQKPFIFICWLLNNFLMPAVGLLLLYSDYVGHQKGTFTFSIGGVLNLLFQLGFLILFPLWYYLFVRHRYESTRVSDGDSVLDFEEAYIECEMPGLAKSRIEWAAVKKFVANKKVILIYISKASFIIIPKHALNTVQDEELLSLLNRHTPGA